MKIVVRVLALGIFAAGASAAVVGSHSPMTPVHQSVTAALPMPSCTPGVPGCIPTGGK